MSLKRKAYAKEPRARVPNWLIVHIKGGKKSSCYKQNRDEVRAALKNFKSNAVVQIFRLHDEFIEAWQVK